MEEQNKQQFEAILEEHKRTLQSLHSVRSTPLLVEAEQERKQSDDEQERKQSDDENNEKIFALLEEIEYAYYDIMLMEAWNALDNEHVSFKSVETVEHWFKLCRIGGQYKDDRINIKYGDEITIKMIHHGKAYNRVFPHYQLLKGSFREGAIEAEKQGFCVEKFILEELISELGNWGIEL